MYLLNNLKFDPAPQRTVGDTQYPPGWFLDATERTKIGVIEVPDPVKPDDNLFTTSENPDGTWLATARSPEEITSRLNNDKALRAMDIKNDRDRRKNHYQVGTKWFHGDVDSRVQQLGLVMMGAGIPAGLQWKTLDGTFVTMTPTLAAQVFAAAAAHDQTLFSVAQQHLEAMEASAAPMAYDYSAGWPQEYTPV